MTQEQFDALNAKLPKYEDVEVGYVFADRHGYRQEVRGSLDGMMIARDRKLKYTDIHPYLWNNGMYRATASRALSELEKVGLVHVTRAPGRKSIVRILGQTPSTEDRSEP